MTDSDRQWMMMATSIFDNGNFLPCSTAVGVDIIKTPPPWYIQPWQWWWRKSHRGRLHCPTNADSDQRCNKKYQDTKIYHLGAICISLQMQTLIVINKKYQNTKKNISKYQTFSSGSHLHCPTNAPQPLIVTNKKDQNIYTKKSSGSHLHCPTNTVHNAQIEQFGGAVYKI